MRKELGALQYCKVATWKASESLNTSPVHRVEHQTGEARNRRLSLSASFRCQEPQV